MLVLFLERVGIREYQLLVNSVGCPNCRAAYLEALRAALQNVKATMCADCQRRADTNPLRVLDCKVEADQPIIEKLPKIIDHLDPECRAAFRPRHERASGARPRLSDYSTPGARARLLHAHNF